MSAAVVYAVLAYLLAREVIPLTVKAVAANARDKRAKAGEQ